MSRLDIKILSLVCAAYTVSVSAAYLDIPQTGQTEPYQALDDGTIESGAKWPTARFVDNTDGTITDKLTGLIWLKDAACADTSGFISGNNVPNWTDAFRFVDDLNNNRLNIACQQYTGTFNDWRIPTVAELASLLRAGLETDSKTVAEWLNVPGTPSSGFVNTGFIHGGAWTSTTTANEKEKVWTVNLLTGEITTAAKQNTNDLYTIFSAVRATGTTHIAPSGSTTSYATGDDATVKTVTPFPSPRFIDLSDGTVVDRMSGLMWLKDINCVPQQTNWSTALGNLVTANATVPNFSCSGYTAKFKDWRLPNFKELFSLIDYGKSNPSLPTNIPVTINTDPSALYWTGTSANREPILYAWTVSLANGSVNAKYQKSDASLYYAPVRGPHVYADLTTEPSELEFGTVYIGQEQISPLPVKIISTGSQDLQLGNLQIEEKTVEKLEFTLGHDLCSGKTLKHNESCTFEVRFEPRKIGDRNTTVRIPSNAIGLPIIEAPIAGTSIESTDKKYISCFIATAAYGSYLDPHVKNLRDFRDRYLITNSIGNAFVEFYYQNSPPIAEWIANRDWARFLTRLALTPVVFIIEQPLFSLALLICGVVIAVYRKRLTRRFTAV